MTHLPFIAAAYGVFLAVACWLSIGATLRLRRAGAKLRAVDPRNRE
jgi:heme exporter protein D